MPARRPLHVHVVIDGLGVGGAETLLADLVTGGREEGLRFSVTALQDRGHSPAADRLRAVGVEPGTLGMTGLVNPGDHRRLWRRIRALRPDVLHGHLEYADLYAGVAARRLRLPCVSTIHVMRWDDDGRSRLKLALQARARRFGMQSVVCVSDAARDAYLAQGWPSPAEVVTVRNGIAAHVDPARAAGVRARLGIPPAAIVVGTLSVLRPGKGHDELLAAVPALRERFAGLEVLVAGTGPDEARIRAAAARVGARAIGHIGDPVAYAGALDVLVHPSHFDAFPTALIEAAAAGTPVVATRVGGIPEIVADGETGVLVDAPPAAAPLADAIGDLVADPSRRERMGAAASDRYDAELSAQAWARRMRAVYERALGR